MAEPVILCKLTRLSYTSGSGGDDGIRTHGLRRAKAALSQLSYIPKSYRSSGPDWIRTSDPCVISTVL